MECVCSTVKCDEGAMLLWFAWIKILHIGHVDKFAQHGGLKSFYLKRSYIFPNTWVDEPIFKLSFHDSLSNETHHKKVLPVVQSSLMFSANFYFVADFTYKQSLFKSTSKFGRSIIGATNWNLCAKLWGWVNPKEDRFKKELSRMSSPHRTLLNLLFFCSWLLGVFLQEMFILRKMAEL